VFPQAGLIIHVIDFRLVGVDYVLAEAEFGFVVVDSVLVEVHFDSVAVEYVFDEGWRGIDSVVENEYSFFMNNYSNYTTTRL